MINALKILIQIGLNSDCQITEREKNILCGLKKDVDQSILKMSVISQETNLIKDLVKNLIEKQLSILPILKR